MDYTTLTGDKSTSGSIKNWMNYSNLPVDEILAEVETEIIRNLRTREMRASATVTITSGSITAALPAGFIDPVRLIHRDTRIEIQAVPMDDIEETRNWSGTDSNYAEGMPTRFSVFNELLQFDMRADAEYVCTMLYYKRPDALSGSNPSNWITTRYPRLVRVACMKAAAEHMKNMEMKNSYEAEMLRMIAEVNQEADLSLTGAIAHMEYRNG